MNVLKLEYLKRLAQPHSSGSERYIYSIVLTLFTANDETFQAYSTFVSRWLPPSDYENTLVHATKVRQPAIAAWRNREKYQLELVSTLFPMIQHTRSITDWNICAPKHTPQAYHRHIQAEQRKRIKSSDPRLRDPYAIINLYERAIAHVAAQRVAGLLKAVDLEQNTGAHDLQAAEAWLPVFWSEYVRFLVRETSIASKHSLSP